MVALAPPAFENADPVHLRQADVENHRIVGLGIAEKVSLLAVEGAVHHVAGALEGLVELAVEVRVVLDDQEAHRWVASVGGCPGVWRSTAEP